MAQPAHGSAPNIFPDLIYDDAHAAIQWLAEVFGFEPGELIEGPAGTIAHAEMHQRVGTIMPRSRVRQGEFGMSPADFGSSPRSLGGITQTVYVAVDNPDAHHERARTAGATILMEPTDTEFGARMYVARDLEGHVWSFGNYWPRR
jgi:uncharacterized glyoxalase superfamily protein PhnB